MRKLSMSLGSLILGGLPAWAQPGPVPTVPTPTTPPPETPAAVGSAYLGLSGEDAPDGGVVVRSVEPNGPAATAGLLAGDIILQVDGQPVARFTDLAGLIQASTPGQTHRFTLRRAGQPDPLTLAATLASRPTGPAGAPLPGGFGRLPNLQEFFTEGMPPMDGARRSYLGIQVQAIDPPLAARLGLPDTEGVLVADVVPDSPAAKAGLRTEDVLLSIDGTAVRSPEQVIALVGAKAANDNVVIRLRRGGELIETTATLAAPRPLPNPGFAMPDPNQFPGFDRLPRAWAQPEFPNANPLAPADAARLQQRIDELEREVRQLREQLNSRLPAVPPGTSAPQ